MDSSTAAQTGSVSEKYKPSILDYIAKGLGSPQLGSLIALSAALSLGAGLILWSIKPNYTPVFEQMDRQDVSQILEVLSRENIPYEMQAKTGLVLVPHDQVDMLRMKLLSSGIPVSKSVGFELLQQEQSLGTSQFMETTRYQHALETELSRTISSMRSIDSARVHLAIPRQSIFIRNRAKASASVMVKLLPGRSLEEGHVSAIINLVASSIPYLESSQVTIVDQWGKLFTSGAGASDSGESRKQFEYSRKIETLYTRRIEQLLVPLIGEGGIRATVTADVDFSVSEQTQELFDADPTQIRSEQSQDQQTSNKGAQGIPGALSNQPPATGTTDAGGETESEKESPLNSTRSSTRNYELDKTITHLRKASGVIRQISVAVIVDDKKVTNEAGEISRTPWSSEEIEKFTALVYKAIGFSEARADSVVVLNQSFQPIEQLLPVEPVPLWEQAWFWGVSKQLLAGLSVLLLILLVVRPAMKNLKRSSNAQPALSDQSAGLFGSEITVDVANGNGQIGSGKNNQAALEAPQQVYGDILNLARAMADDDPKRVAKVVKDWVGSADG